MPQAGEEHRCSQLCDPGKSLSFSELWFPRHLKLNNLPAKGQGWFLGFSVVLLPLWSSTTALASTIRNMAVARLLKQKQPKVRAGHTPASWVVGGWMQMNCRSGAVGRSSWGIQLLASDLESVRQQREDEATVKGQRARKTVTLPRPAGSSLMLQQNM